jgi:predicted DCC family thiol-disulfide oxidoreductase YuxK
VLIAGDRVTLKSGAVIEILSLLKGFRWAAAMLRCIPESIRERFYDRVARNRYRWFGRQTACYSGEEAYRHRFLS